MKRNYVVADVFTNKVFSGNPLAVVLDAEGLETDDMQRIAREFNFSETTFVLPAKSGGDFNVRIFTPGSEVPFAGHPNIGTALVLHHQSLLPNAEEVMFEELAGNVPVSMKTIEDGLVAELRAPESLSYGQTVDAEHMAAILSLPVTDIVIDNHAPVQASVGLPFFLVEVASLDALQRCKVNPIALEEVMASIESPFIHVYVRSNDEFDIRTRMFAPTDGVPEDPATGSANCALAAVLAHLDERDSGEFEWKIAQGVEMGRPSELNARVIKNAGEVSDVYIGGQAVMVMEGALLD